MIEYKQGDLLAESVDALVNAVNCVGVMGRGIALHFKRMWPENFKAYAAACRRGELQPGRIFVFETGQLAPPRYIINFPTKHHWRDPSRIEEIEAGLADLEAIVFEPQGVPEADRNPRGMPKPQSSEPRSRLARRVLVERGWIPAAKPTQDPTQ